MRGKKGPFFLLGLVVIVIIAVVAYLNINNDQAEVATNDEDEAFDPKPDPDSKQISYYDNKRKFNQEKIEENLVTEYKKEDYSFNKPYMVLDPYNVAPLTALVKFDTKQPVKISVTVDGKDDNSDITKTYKGYHKEHDIPILGLYPDYKNTVTLKAINKDGDAKEKKLKIQTNGLPDEVLKTDLVKADQDKMEEGLTFAVPSNGYVFAVDENTDVRWYASLPTRHIFKRLKNGHLLYVTKDKKQDQYNDLFEMDMLGKITNAYKIHIDGYDDSNLIHHDAIEMPNGNLLATTHDPQSDYVKDQMTEIDRKTGKSLRRFNDRDVFPEESYEEYDGKHADEGDWFHQNAIWFDHTDNMLLISGRSQDTVMKISYPKGSIKWILAAHEKWPDSYNKYLLEPKGDSFKFPAGQHAVKVLPDMDEDTETTDILLFDNNNVITRGDKNASGNYSRAVQYRINEKNMTVKKIWEYGKERGKSFFSSVVGNTQYMPDTGNRLITSGYIEDPNDSDRRFSDVVEVNDQDSADVVFEMKSEAFEEGSSRQIYRAMRMTLYPKQKWDFDLKD